VSYEVMPKARCVRAVAVFVLLGAIVAPFAAKADSPTPLNVLFVANGWCSQEDDIESHFLDLGYNVTLIKDYKVKGSTSFAAYDLIVLTESAPLVSAAGLNAIKASGKPVLVVESWTFMYAYRLGLTTSPIARLSDGDTVTSLVDGYTAFTSRVGAEALVHQTASLVFGINPAHVKSTVTPLYQSTGCMSGVALFVDYTKKIGVTGISDTGGYTVDAWKMFDILVQQIVPTPQERETMQEVVQAYAESGLPSFIAQVQRENREQPGSWTLDEAESEAWARIVEWRLDELWDFVTYQLYEMFEFEGPDLLIDYTPPTRPHGVGTNWLPDSGVYADEEEHWFLGQYWNPDDGNLVYPPFFWSQYHAGTDLGFGANAKLNGKQFFYMGDTWDIGTDVHKWSEKECEVGAGVRCDDMIVVSSDDDPSDGIVVSPVLGIEANPDTHLAEWRWTPVVIPGVHKEISPYLQNPSGALFWTGDIPEPRYTVPTGVVAARLPFVTDLPVPWTMLHLPTVVLWYGTAINPNPGKDDLEELTFSSTDPTRRPASWVGCSFDGIHFRACYTDVLGNAVPFSSDLEPYSEEPIIWPPTGGECDYSGPPARFIQVAAVDVTASDFDAMCSINPDLEICRLYDPDMPSMADGGLLLYGSGRPYRKSGLFLAFIQRSEFGQVDPFTGKPFVHYYWADSDGTASGWSMDEQDATPLTGDPPCDRFLQPNYAHTTHTAGCWPDGNPSWNSDSVFGEISARLIRSTVTGVEPQIVLFGNGNWMKDPEYPDNYLRWLYAWKAPLAEPWAGDFFPNVSPMEMKTAGYGAYIIDAYGDSVYTGSDIVLWHTVSVYKGDDPANPTPYGVYTGSEVIPWSE
jgi:hypothetical protein